VFARAPHPKTLGIYLDEAIEALRATCSMNVLALFDGISCGQVALDRAGISVNDYYSSEIDKYAIQVTQSNYPDTIQLGDITQWRKWDIDWASIDLLTAGFPCQAWSVAGKQKGDNDPRGALVHDLIDIWKHTRELNPNLKFMFENVRIKKEFLDYINDLFGVEPVLINSSLVSAQNRKRYYWTNIEGVEQPEDKGILLRDVLEEDVDKKYAVSDSKIDRILNSERGKGFFYNQSHEKTGTLIALYNKLPTDGIYIDDGFKRKLTPLECERLQTLPDNYTDYVSNSQRYKAIGNGWTVDVISHIFKGLL